jgi:hypothetical protein
MILTKRNTCHTYILGLGVSPVEKNPQKVSARVKLPLGIRIYRFMDGLILELEKKIQ